MNDDHLIERLKALCGRFSDEPLDGRYVVAEKTGLSEQYLYQLIDGRPMANGNKRSLGKIARAKISSAFPDWLNYQADRTATHHRTADSAAEPPERGRHRRDLVQKVCDLAEQINDDGLRELAGFARCLTGTHPFTKPAAPKRKKAA